MEYGFKNILVYFFTEIESLKINKFLNAPMAFKSQEWVQYHGEQFLHFWKYTTLV